MNQYFKPLVIGLMIIGLMAISSLNVSAVAQNQSSSNMTPGGQNMTLQDEGSSGLNKTTARNESAGGGGTAPS